MRLTKKHKEIEKLHTKYLNALNRLLSVIDTLPNANQNCDCGDKYDMGRMDYDIDYSDGTGTIVCMSCGGLVTP